MIDHSNQGERIRRVLLRPYLKGKGPVFTLDMFECYRNDYPATQTPVGYRLAMKLPGQPSVVLFEGDDYGCAPGDATDSDASVEALMSFLTLCPGDTGDEYFAGYGPVQTDYCEQYAETLQCEVSARFGTDNEY